MHKRIKMEPQLEGINFVTDSNNKRIAVMIDLAKYGELWQDFYDLLLALARKDEEDLSLEEVRKQLQTQND